MLKSNQNVRGLTVGIVFILTIGVTLGILFGVVYSAEFDNIFSLKENLPAFMNSIATIVLVIVTSGYVALTYLLVSENKRSRMQNVKPVLNLSYDPYALGASGPKVENIGNGPAMEISATIKLEPDGEESQITSKSIPPGSFEGSLTPRIGSETHKNYSKLSAVGTFEDMFGNEYPFEDEFDLQLLAESDGATSMMDRDTNERKLKKIEKHLRNISDSIDFEEIDRQAKIRTRKVIRDEIQSEKAITIKELAQRTGMHPYDLSHILADLKWAGAIEIEKPLEEILSDDDFDAELKLKE